MKPKYLIILFEVIVVLLISSILVFKSINKHKESLDYLKENKVFKKSKWVQTDNPLIKLEINSTEFSYIIPSFQKTYKYTIEDKIEIYPTSNNDNLYLTLSDSVNVIQYQIKVYNKSNLEFIEIPKGIILKFEKTKD